jgi:hypothetical protein
MSTVKEILSANRVSVINNIKWYFKTNNQTEIIEIMKAFLSFCEKNTSAEKLNSSTRIKTDLKLLVYGLFCKEQKIERKINEQNAMTAKWNKMTEEEKYNLQFQSTHDLQLEIRKNTRQRWGI